VKTIKALLVGMGLTALCLATVAQEEDAAPERYIYASYFSCPGGSLTRADELIAEDADRMDQFVKDGTIQSWGWLAHHTGGKWQRVSSHSAGSLDALLDGSDAIQSDDDDDEEEEASDEPTFGQICNMHEDYIWQVKAGTLTTVAERGSAGFSVYYVCDLNGEERADEIVKEHFAPLLDKFVADGKLSSWGWSSHVVGGEYRRLQTMTAADMKSLLAARSEAIEAVYGEDNAAGEEFTELCGPHVDYMWNVIHETP